MHILKWYRIDLYNCIFLESSSDADDSDNENEGEYLLLMMDYILFYGENIKTYLTFEIFWMPKTHFLAIKRRNKYFNCFSWDMVGIVEVIACVVLFMVSRSMGILDLRNRVRPQVGISHFLSETAHEIFLKLWS